MRHRSKVLIGDIRALGWQAERLDVGHYRFTAPALECSAGELRAGGGVRLSALQSYVGGVFVFDVRATDERGHALELDPDSVFELWGEQPPALPVTEEI